MVIVADKASSLEKLERYIDAEALESMGVPAAAGRTPADGLRPPTLGAIAASDHLHFYLMAFARKSRIAMSGSKQNGVFDRHYPEADVWIGEQGYRASKLNLSESTSTFSSPTRPAARIGPSRDDERTLSPAEQSRLEIRFGVINPDPPTAPAAKSKSKAKKNSRKR